MERLRFAASGRVEGRTLSGIAHVYGTVTIDGRKHSFAPGTFAESIASGQVVSMLGHEESKLLASQKAGTLRLSDGPNGLQYGIDLPEGVSYAEDLRLLAARGEEVGMSLTFVPSKPGRRVKGVTVWEAGRLLSVDPVALPAFDGTTAMLSSAQFGNGLSDLVKIRYRIQAKSARVGKDA